MLDIIKESIFLRKPVTILLFVFDNKNTTKSYLSKKTDITYAYVCKILKKLKGDGYIEVDKVGRECLLSLTNQGKAIAEKLSEIREVLHEN